MKKLALALILALVLTMIFSIPVLADDGQGNMPGKANDLGDNWKGLNGAIRRIGVGSGKDQGKDPPRFIPGIHISVNHAIQNVMNGDLPTNPMQ